jgi:ribosome-binding factor A
VTTLGGKDQSKHLTDALNFEFKKLIGPITREMKLKKTPKLHFIIDDSYERQMYIDKLIENARSKTK